MAKKPKHQEEDEAEAEELEAPELMAAGGAAHVPGALPPQPPTKPGVQGQPTTAAAEAVAKVQWFIHVG